MKDFVENFGSKKLFAFIAASILLVAGSISEETWKWIATAYLASQGVVDVGKYVGKKKKETTNE